MQAGPAAETRPVQKVIIAVAFVSVVAMIVVSALDIRFGWSAVPAPVSVLGLVLVAVGLGIAMMVTIQNGYAAANITVEVGPAGGRRRAVRLRPAPDVLRQRRPDGRRMPLALDSYWGLLVILVPAVAVLAFRIIDEEKAAGTGTRRIRRIHAEGALPAGARRLVTIGADHHTTRNTATTANRSTVFAIIVVFGSVSPM